MPTMEQAKSHNTTFGNEQPPYETTTPLDRYRMQAGTKNARYVERWLEWLATQGPSRPSDTTMARYLRYLQETGLKDGTVDLHHRIIGAYYRFQGLPAPKARGWRYDSSEASRPALSTGSIETMIRAAREGELTLRQMSCLCLATIYGCRVGEMAQIQNDDVKWDQERIYLRTEKGGPARWIYLPSQLYPYLQKTWEPCLPDSMAGLFDAIWCAVAEVDRPARTGWHSIRRALNRDFELAGLGIAERSLFMRWAGGGGDGEPGYKMANLYAHPNAEIDIQSGQHAVVEKGEGLREHDEDAWRLHPYLPYWSN